MVIDVENGLLDIPRFWETITPHRLHGTEIEDEPRVLIIKLRLRAQ